MDTPIQPLEIFTAYLLLTFGAIATALFAWVIIEDIVEWWRGY